jgi:LPS export ABC transporter permease LptG/LPS export ABC transporter permease LptF
MRLLSRAVFREVATAALLGGSLFTLILFLQRVGSGLFQLLVRSAATPKMVAQLVGLALPFYLPFTLPLGVLVGVLIGLSRMSSDGEITALRSAGVSGRRVALPALSFAFLALLATGAASCWLTPWSLRVTNRIAAQLAAAQLTAEVQPRVFEEQFEKPKVVLYVEDVTPLSNSLARWRNIFIADMTPPKKEDGEAEPQAGAPRVTLAQAAVARPDTARNRIQLSLLNSATYEVKKGDREYNVSMTPSSEQVLEAEKPAEVRSRHPEREMDTVPLYRLAYRTPGLEPLTRTEARIEFHQRLSLPLACVLLALVGIPLGVSSRRSAKSSAFVLTVALAFVYYIGLIAMIGVAKQGRIPVELAVWTPNAVFLAIGLTLLARLEAPGDRDWLGTVRSFFGQLGSWVSRSLEGGTRVSGRVLPRLVFLPQIIDTYVLSSFVFWFLVLLTSFVLISHVYTFFELLNDIIRNQVPMPRVLRYLFFLTPKYLYDSTPISVLVAVLATFGVAAKNNEVTAFKACGVSLMRLATPVFIASILLGGGLFAFDHLYIPEANRIQDALRNEIKGRPVQTYLRPDRKWVRGLQDRLYFYKYFDPKETAMLGVSVFDIDWQKMQVRSHIQAERARWEPALKTWVFQNGWTRTFSGLAETNFDSFAGQTRTYAELGEAPDYFLKEVKQGKQMNFQELERYMAELTQSGFDTVQLQVQYHKKFSVPVFAVIMAMIAAPFAFSTGARGAMAAVGLSFGIAIAYIAVNQLFEQVGNLNQLPPTVAAWSPDLLFGLAGLYFLARMRS